jgi:hypothetical protein
LPQDDVPSREDEVEMLAGQIETLLQKWERKQLASFLLGSTDAQSLDHSIFAGRYRLSRTLLTAGIYEFADTLVNGVKSS